MRDKEADRRTWQPSRRQSLQLKVRLFTWTVTVIVTITVNPHPNPDAPKRPGTSSGGFLIRMPLVVVAS